MKAVIYDAQTKVTTIEDVPDVEIPNVESPTTPSQEERLTTVETVQDEIIGTLAVVMGVTL